MALIFKHSAGVSEATITALEEVWADKDGNPVPYGDESGKSVLVGKGGQIAVADAIKYGLIPDPAKAEAEAAAKAKADADKAAKVEAEKLAKAEKAEAEAAAKASQGNNAQP